MINVLHTIDTTGPGGAETVFIHLATGLDQRKFTSVAAIRGPGWVCDRLREKGKEPIFLQSKGGFNFPYLWELVRIVKKYKIDIIQSHLLGSSLYGCLAGKICGVPVISTMHGFVDAANNERLMWLKCFIINLGAGKIVFVSHRLRSHFVENLGFSEKKSISIYNGVDTATFFPNRDDSIRREFGIEPHNIVIGAVGNIRPAKGYDIFLKAARLIHDKLPHCRFIVTGQGSGKLYRNLIQLRKELALEKVFHLAGFRSDTAKVMNNYDLFVLPSTSEGFSISTIEAMACGVPVVVTKSGGPEEIVEDKIHGLMVPPGNPEALAGSIIDFLKQERPGEIFKASAMSKIQTQLSLSASISNYTALYQELKK